MDTCLAVSFLYDRPSDIKQLSNGQLLGVKNYEALFK